MNQIVFRKVRWLIDVCDWLQTLSVNLNEGISLTEQEFLELNSLVSEIPFRLGSQFKSKSLKDLYVVLTSKDLMEIAKAIRAFRNALINTLTSKFSYLNISEDFKWSSKSIKKSEALALSTKLDSYLADGGNIDVGFIQDGNFSIITLSGKTSIEVVNALTYLTINSNSASINEVRKLL